MASLSSLRPRTQESRNPCSMYEQNSNSSQSFNCSSLSSARTSELSGTYILSRTDNSPRSLFSSSISDPSLIQEKNKDESSFARRTSRQKERELKGIDRQPSPPTITYFPPSPSASMLSVNTYDPRFSECNLDHDFADIHEDQRLEMEPGAQRLHAVEDLSIPNVLCPYRARSTDSSPQPSTPHTFGLLFPSQGRLSICHDDTTPDGNMNLRVDTVTSGLGGSRRWGRSAKIQLFHLRMYDLADRNFSLRRYCRDSGREVCLSKRAYAATSTTSRHGIQQSVSSALRSVKVSFRRSNASNSSFLSLKSSSSSRRPSTGAETSKSAPSFPGDHDSSNRRSSRLAAKSSASVLVPTDTIKLEFGNYARVEVSRQSSKRYGFEWWGHTYTWKRSVDKQLDTFSFHLMRDDKHKALAHIVQEMQSPSEIDSERRAGGWIPPCYMWISDQSVMDSLTDVADVIIATGLVALVDDCIREEWQSNKPFPHPAPFRTEQTHLGSEQPSQPGVFSRRKPLRFGKAVAVY